MATKFKIIIPKMICINNKKTLKSVMNKISLFSTDFQPERFIRDRKLKVKENLQKTEKYNSRINQAENFRDVWEIVQETVKICINKQRLGILLFLDDLPIQLGAYHQLGTNNIVLNRTLVNIVESVTKSKKMINAFIYSILTHEYLHALGYVSESEVRSLVYEISRTCFGENHAVTSLATETPWSILKGIPLNGIKLQKQPMELVKDLEKSNYKYII